MAKVSPYQARQRILHEANNYRSKRWMRSLSMRHIQHAVCIVRRKQLFKNEKQRHFNLERAGFNPEPRR